MVGGEEEGVGGEGGVSAAAAVGVQVGVWGVLM